MHLMQASLQSCENLRCEESLEKLKIQVLVIIILFWQLLLRILFSGPKKVLIK